MGHIGDKIGAQRLHTCKLLRQSVDALRDLPEMKKPVHRVGHRYPCAEISIDQFLQNLLDLPNWLFHCDLSADPIDAGEQKTEQKHISKG